MSIVPLLASKRSLCLFASYLACRSANTSQNNQVHLVSGSPSPYSVGRGDPFTAQLSQLSYVLRGIQRLEGSAARRPRLPITPVELNVFKRAWSKWCSRRDASMLWAACCTGFFVVFLRAEEFTVKSLATFDEVVYITPRDVSIDSVTASTMIRLRLKQSKTAPFRHGAVITLDRTRQDICLVLYLLCSPIYSATRQKSGSTVYILRRISSFSPKRVSEVQRLLVSEGMSCKGFTGHSFRIGAATTAKAKGVADSTLKTLGC